MTTSDANGVLTFYLFYNIFKKTLVTMFVYI